MEEKETFAERMLRKQGWTDGQGLGKTQQGIVDPIKPTLKFDKTGIGHDHAEEFTNNWWDLAFQKAANKIEVEETKDGQIDVKSKKRSKKKKKREKAEAKNALYAGFTKSATLSDGRMIEESSNTDKKEQDSSSDDEMDKFSAVTKLLSDENLFKAAGITAHKGARHGCTMKAKLQRVEESDQKYLEEQALKKKRKIVETVDEAPVKKKKKSSREIVEEIENIETVDEVPVKKKKKSSRKVVEEIENIETVDDEAPVKKKKKKKKSSKEKVEEIPR